MRPYLLKKKKILKAKLLGATQVVECPEFNSITIKRKGGREEGRKRKGRRKERREGGRLV
jgi:hypothetical protein